MPALEYLTRHPNSLRPIPISRYKELVRWAREQGILSSKARNLSPGQWRMVLENATVDA
jgi:hypothetical protein